MSCEQSLGWGKDPKYFVEVDRGDDQKEEEEAGLENPET